VRGHASASTAPVDRGDVGGTTTALNEDKMGFVEVFNIMLSDFFNGPISLICTRDFQGSYFLETETFKVRLENPQNFAQVRTLLRKRAITSGGGEMRPGYVWRRAGVIEIGISENNSIYVQFGDVRIEPADDQVKLLLFALTRMQDDYADIERAEHSGGAEIPPAALRRGFAIRIPGGDGEWM
jgi:hypothetical protein